MRDVRVQRGKLSTPVLDPFAQLRRRNQRQKSDVAQKLVAMCLHDLSSKLIKEWPELKVETPSYSQAVREAFSDECAFCDSKLAADTHVEHLVAMNRARCGLHIAGNVVLSCKRCNNAKRRDDQALTRTFGTSGWDNFLGHDGSCVQMPCSTCSYWKSRVDSPTARRDHMNARSSRIREFRQRFRDIDTRSFANALEAVYRKWQGEAENATEEFTQSALASIFERPVR